MRSGRGTVWASGSNYLVFSESSIDCLEPAQFDFSISVYARWVMDDSFASQDPDEMGRFGRTILSLPQMRVILMWLLVIINMCLVEGAGVDFLLALVWENHPYGGGCSSRSPALYIIAKL